MKLPARWLLTLLPAATLLLLLLGPMARLAWEGFAGDGLAVDASAAGVWALWQDEYLRWRLAWSLMQAALTCVAALAVGLPVAWVLARFEFVGRSWVLRLLMLPFVVPTLVAAMGVLTLWGPNGLLGADLEDSPWLLLYGNLFF
ncbi:MAG: hypothetical protein RL459_1533, partial [Pseudomonadota bacterium]